MDVFFVISGFVITGVLLRERASSGHTSILAFYGRRSRRIIPAATLVIIVTVVTAYHFLGNGGGIPTASDGRWAAVFLANFHFMAANTNYLASAQPPSPLQNLWSLAVEEQFYVVYPTLFLLIAAVKLLTFRTRMVIGLVLIIGASLTYSIVDTANNPTGAFFSPLTRAWELALGALIAIGTPWLLKVPKRLAAGATWLGLGAIAFAAVCFTSQSVYPGSLVIIPVVGSALIIAGGMKAHTLGVESLLHLPSFQWFGKISYSLYLWHWPILIIAAEHAGKSTLSVKDNLAWVLVALLVSIATYRLVENPIRHARPLLRSGWASVGLAFGLVAVTLSAIAIQAELAAGSTSRANSQRVDMALINASPVPLSNVLNAVAASTHIRKLPSNLVPSLEQVLTTPLDYIGFPTLESGCNPGLSISSVPKCLYGDTSAHRTMVLYGDSHAGMWFRVLEKIAKNEHWKLVVLFKQGCPPVFASVPSHGNNTGSWQACDNWHTYATNRIKRMDPDLLIISEGAKFRGPTGAFYTPRQWQVALQGLLQDLSTPDTLKVVLGSPAVPGYDGPTCLTRHLDDVQACSGPPDPGYMSFNNAEQTAARLGGARYINIMPWLCTNICSFVVKNLEVYQGRDHITLGYTFFLDGALTHALDLPKVAASRPGLR